MNEHLRRILHSNQRLFIASHRIYEFIEKTPFFKLLSGSEKFDKTVEKFIRATQERGIEQLRLTRDGLIVRREMLDINYVPFDSSGVLEQSAEEKNIVKYIAEKAGSGLVLDVGANAGIIGISVALKNPSAKVICFEPVGKTYAQLSKNILLNKTQGRVEALRVALGEIDKSGYITTDLHGTNHLVEKNSKNTQTVKVVTLDGLMRRRRLKHVRVIKADIEGAELRMLRGAERLLQTQHPSIVIEIQAQWTSRYGYRPRDVFSFLKKFGYKYRLVTPKGIARGSDYRDLDKDLFQASNFIFEPVSSRDRAGRSSTSPRRSASR